MRNTTCAVRRAAGFGSPYTLTVCTDCSAESYKNKNRSGNQNASSVPEKQCKEQDKKSCEEKKS